MELVDYDKAKIRTFVLDEISGKIKTLEFYRNFTFEASKDIKKTPKYDSFREEMQEELYHLDKQMHYLVSMQNKMKRIMYSGTSSVQLGSVVITNKARFYISVAFGEFFFEGDRFYAISEESPMGQVMSGKEVGDEFTLNKIYQKILKII